MSIKTRTFKKARVLFLVTYFHIAGKFFIDVKFGLFFKLYRLLLILNI